MSGACRAGSGWGARGRGGGSPGGRQWASADGGSRGLGSMPAAPASGLDQDVVQSVLGRATTSAKSPNVTAPARPAVRASGTWSSPPSFGPSTGSATPEVRTNTPLYDVYVVLDFEATCVREKKIENQEIIEFPMVLVDARTHTIVAEFQRYVKPVVNPVLSAFCTELTGITQSQVEHAQTFEAVFAEAKRFLASAGLGDAPPHRSYCLVTCGDWDLKTMLPAQLRLSGQLGLPSSFQRWCNLKAFMSACDPPLSPHTTGGPHRVSATSSRCPQSKKTREMHITGMPGMLAALGLSLQGRHHSGIDDCRNIAHALCELLNRGYRVRATADAGSEPATPWLAPEDAAWAPLSALHSSLATHSEPSAPIVPTDVQPPAAEAIASSPQFRDAAHEGVAQKKGRKEEASEGAAPERLPALIVDTSRDPMSEGAIDGPVSEPWKQKTLSKSLSHLLRHGADERHIPITVNGYARVRDVLNEPTIRKLNVSLSDIMHIVASSDKQRFRLAYRTSGGDDTLYICAAQGHSLPGVMPDLIRITSIEACPQAIHGTYWAAWKQILESGYLSPMSRTHIHFAKGLPKDASVISGMRKSVEIVLYLDVAAVLRDGIELFESSNGVILTAGVGDTRQLPLKYISKVVDQKTKKTVDF